MLTKAIYSKRFCRIMQDSAWFCKIMLNSETFCMFYEKFEAYLPKILLRNYQRLKQTLPIWRYGVQKLNYQRSKLPILKVTNIEVYLYTKLPPKFVIGLIHSMWLLSSSQNTFMDYNIYSTTIIFIFMSFQWRAKQSCGVGIMSLING